MRIESQLQIVYWSVSKLTRYIRNPRKNDGVVDRICRVDLRVRLRHLSHALFDGPFKTQIAIDHRPIGLRKNWH